MPEPVPQSDGQRFAAWVGEHGSAVRGFVMALVRRGDVADDLTQETFARAWQARDRYTETGSIRAYLLRIADRLVCDRGRTLHREVCVDGMEWQRIEPSAATVEPAARLAQGEAERALAAALETLSVAQRRVLLLRYYSDMDFAEIARTMEIPLNTALSHCRRGLLALRKVLVEQEEASSAHGAT